MRYVVVNARIPKGLPRACPFCAAKVEEGYTRELKDGLVYDTPMCLEAHRFAMNLALGMSGAPKPVPHLGRAS